jgi:hypothetical protein
MRLAGCGVLYCVLLLTAACSATPAPQPTTTVTVVSPSLSGSVAPPSLPPPSVTASAQVGVVPNVVGVNHQLAQDTMQAAGFYYLTEVDATGKGRLLINDRNWVVVSQAPAAGAKVPLDTKIVLRSKKIGE